MVTTFILTSHKYSMYSISVNDNELIRRRFFCRQEAELWAKAYVSSWTCFRLICDYRG
jgi:hypothetical protein